MNQDTKSNTKITTKIKNKLNTKTKNKILGILLSVFTLIVVVVGVFLYFQDIQTKKRIEEFYSIEKTLKEKKDVSITQVEDFITKYKYSPQAELARYYLALYYLSLKNYTKTEEWLLLTSIDQQETIGTLAKIALANTYQQKKEYQKANNILQSVGVPVLADYLLIEIIQNNILDNKIEEAKSLLYVFLRDYKNSILKDLAEETLRLIN